MKIYRAQDCKYTELIPTALRLDLKAYMENEINIFFKQNNVPCCLEKAKEEIKQRSILPHPTYKEFLSEPLNYHDETEYINFLSALNIIIKCYNVPFFCEYITDFMHDIPSLTLLAHKEKCMPFDWNKVIEGIIDQVNLAPYKWCAVYSNFQHLNWAFSKTVFPTLMLDFTDCPAVLDTFKFKNEKSNVYSIEFDQLLERTCFSQWSSTGFVKEWEETYIGIFTYNSRTTKWFEDTKSGELLHEKMTFPDNHIHRFMELQKGYCIYWPWRRTIEQLEKEPLFGFEITERSIFDKRFIPG